MVRQEGSGTDAPKFGREFFGLFLLFWALLLLLSLFSFSVDDPSLNHVVSNAVTVRNKAGLFGAYTAGFLNDVLGVAAFLCPLIFCALGAAYVSSSYSLHWSRWVGFFLLTLCFLVIASSLDMTLGDLSGGGMVGNSLYGNARRYLSPTGSALLWVFVGLVGIQLVSNISWFGLAGVAVRWVRERLVPRIMGRFVHNTTEVTVATGESSVSSDKSLERSMQLSLKSSLNGFFFSSLRDVGCRLRDYLGNIRRSREPLPEVHGAITDKLDNTGEHVDRCGTDPRLERDDDEPFAVAEDFEGRPISPQGDLPEAPPTPVVSAGEHFTDTTKTTSDISSIASEAQSSSISNENDGVEKEKGHKGSLSRLFTRKAPIPLPSLDLLLPAASGAGSAHRGEFEDRGRMLLACLHDFDIQSELVRITPGPVVTMFEIRPAPGVRVNRIANMSDDIARALKAVAVRIQAPIPGTDTVGIEIPNEHRETVNFRELAASEAFRKGCGPLTMILGKDIAGKPFMADLTRMPHLLVAGATGAGKSVCLNGILVSLLYRTQPSDLQLLLVDPKRIEMAVYADEPHLVHPVVTEMNEAKNALDWAVHEMDRRYEAMARLQVRNVAGFNQKLAAYKRDLPPELSDLEPMPYLVIVIDELADLMMTAAREEETSIVRLAQLARAAGIHMILATQRPSVDVVTGLIKANFPCRISFQVTSKHDSRTILDQVGAEHLLGRGDMLYKPSGGRLQRLHGPFLSDEEVQAVVAHWKHHLTPSYKVDFSQWGLETVTGGASAGGGDAAQDPLYAEVQNFASDQGRVSISSIQRRFKIGFNRAARLVEQLEFDGVIGPADGSKPRTVVR
ncbi:MAG: DNA translocase FtsK 4TM domain-containing protein [Desulfovibrio sp.]|nr:DNA translocase FtsK 4TM domain-containing protein [Desulfovibrio sp.]